MAFRIKKAYITGVTGTIGMALLDYLLNDGTEVEAFVRPESSRLDSLETYRLGLGNEPAERFVINRTGLDGLFDYATNADIRPDGPAVFYHLGWEGTIGSGRNDADVQKRNVKYSVDAAELAHRLGCTIFVGAGSQAEYGRVDGVIDEDTPLNPETEYGRAKNAARIATAECCRKYGMGHTWVRILSVYGPYNDERTMIMTLINSLLEGREALLTKGLQVWDYLYCKDAARALALMGGSEAATGERIYCLGSGEGRPLADYIYDICNECGASKELLKFGAVPYKDQQVMHLLCDIKKAQRELGFMPVYSFKEGIRETIKWINQERKK